MDQKAIAELTSYPIVTFTKGDNILNYDENANHFIYYIIEGHAMRQIITSAGEEIFFEEYLPGKTVYALLGPFVLYTTIAPIHGNTMTALSDVRAHRLSAIEFDAFLDHHPEVMKELIRRLTAEYTMLLNNFVGKQKGQAPPRVASFILERATTASDGRLLFSRCCSVSDIARFLGMHRITANKIILALRNAGAINYNDNNELEILDRELLEEYAQGLRKIDYKK